MDNDNDSARASTVGANVEVDGAEELVVRTETCVLEAVELRFAQVPGIGIALSFTVKSELAPRRGLHGSKSQSEGSFTSNARSDS